MTKSISRRARSLSFFVILSMMLAGCSTPAPVATPTLDDSAIVAAAVETISAQMTADALNNPSPTPLPTQTPLPPSPTPVPPTETTLPSSEPTATFTQTQPPAAPLSAKLLYVVTFPENKRIYVPNEKYGLALGFENTGTLTWEAGSTVKLVSFVGEVTIQTELAVDEAVKPGERVEFDLWVFGSETLGYHEFYFQLYTNSGLAIPGGVAVYSYTSV